MKRILLIKAGDVQPPLLTTHGDYDVWFARALAGLCQLDVVQAPRGARLPPPGGYDGVIMTGSPLSVTVLAPWMERAAGYMVDAAEHRVPVLGVCFGHQLLGHAFGARVIRNPNGREVGSVEVRLTPEGIGDPLFAGLPGVMAVQTTHEDVIEGLPRGAVALAGNANTRLQAMSLGARIRGVQFHPELDSATMGALITARRERLGSDADRLLAAVRWTPESARILRNFVERWI